MGKTGGHPKLLLVFTAQAGTDPLAERGRRLAAIHRHIKDFPLDAAHQLPLGMGILLKVQTAQNPLAGAGMVVLDERNGGLSVRLKGAIEVALVPALVEEAAGIAKHPGGDQERPYKLDPSRRGERLSLHRCTPEAALGSRRSRSCAEAGQGI